MYERTPWRMLAVASLAVLVCGCATRIGVGPGKLPDGSHAWSVAEWLALASGLAGIGCAIVFAFLKEYAAAISAGLGCVGLCAAFLVLPAVVLAFKWAFVACMVFAVLGVGYLAVTRIRHPDAPLPRFFNRKKVKP